MGKDTEETEVLTGYIRHTSPVHWLHWLHEMEDSKDHASLQSLLFDGDSLRDLANEKVRREMIHLATTSPALARIVGRDVDSIVEGVLALNRTWNGRFWLCRRRARKSVLNCLRHRGKE